MNQANVQGLPRCIVNIQVNRDFSFHVRERRGTVEDPLALLAGLRVSRKWRCSLNYAYLHGFASGPKATKALALGEALARKDIRLHVPDLNAPDFAHLTVSRSMAVVEELTRDGGPWNLIGSSMGALTAAFFAALHPERVHRVLLLCPAFHLDKLFHESLGPEGLLQWEATGAHEFLDATGNPAPVNWELFTDLSGYSSLPPVLHPTHVIHGTLDSSVPIAFSRRFADTSDLVTLQEIEDDHRMIGSTGLVCEAALNFFTTA